MNNDTILKMQKMRLPALVQNYREQLEHPELYDSMTFAERVALMVDAEYDTRENNKIKRKRKILRLPQKQRRFSAALGMAVIRKFFRPGQ